MVTGNELEIKPIVVYPELPPNMFWRVSSIYERGTGRIRHDVVEVALYRREPRKYLGGVNERKLGSVQTWTNQRDTDKECRQLIETYIKRESVRKLIGDHG